MQKAAQAVGHGVAKDVLHWLTKHLSPQANHSIG
jgi:hypothetical protein